MDIEFLYIVEIKYMYILLNNILIVLNLFLDVKFRILFVENSNILFYIKSKCLILIFKIVGKLKG